jgi:hypothetical protein
MKTISDIFDVVGGPGKMAEYLNVKPSTASEMKRRQSIPVIYWPRLVDVCREQSIRGVNFDTLVLMHVHKAEAA